MSLEIELKYPLPDPSHVTETLGVAWGDAYVETDRYLRHPAKDFSTTGEALRLRLSDDAVLVTYKGPRQAHAVKTRREIELPLGRGQADLERFAELFAALGFEPVAEVRKVRRQATVERDGRKLTLCLDRVDQIGDYLEIEAIAEPDDVAAAQAAVAALAAQLDLGQLEPRSYLTLLLAKPERK